MAAAIITCHTVNAAVKVAKAQFTWFSVSGPKIYSADTEVDWYDHKAEKTQLYQIIHIDDDTLQYRAMTVTDEVYDVFEHIKFEDDFNSIIENIAADTAERTHDNTLPKPADPPAEHGHTHPH